MFEKPKYIELNDAIKIIEEAKKKNLISSRAKELIITDLYFLTNIDKYHRPQQK